MAALLSLQHICERDGHVCVMVPVYFTSIKQGKPESVAIHPRTGSSLKLLREAEKAIHYALHT